MRKTQHTLTSQTEFLSRFKYDPNKDNIGSGGFCEVYKVEDSINGSTIVLKEAKKTDVKFNLKREMEITNRLPYHKNVVRYDQYFSFNVMRTELEYLTMPYYQYGNLDDVMRDHVLSLKEIEDIFSQIVGGLHHLHQHGIIHRDLKPANILMKRENDEWMPIISDFGLSKESSGTGTTSNSSIALTYDYAAPEQIQNGKIKPNVDLWALGVILYKMIVGRLPFESDNPDGETKNRQMEISKKITNVAIPNAINEIASPFQEIIKWCLVYDTTERIADTSTLLNMLQTGQIPPPPNSIKNNNGTTETVMRTPKNEAEEETVDIFEEETSSGGFSGVVKFFTWIIVPFALLLGYSAITIKNSLDNRLAKYDEEIKFMSSLLPVFFVVAGKDAKSNIKSEAFRMKNMIRDIDAFDEETRDLKSNLLELLEVTQLTEEESDNLLKRKGERYIEELVDFDHVFNLLEGQAEKIKDEMEEVEEKYEERLEGIIFYIEDKFFHMEDFYLKYCAIRKLRENPNFEKYYKAGDISVEGFRLLSIR